MWNLGQAVTRPRSCPHDDVTDIDANTELDPTILRDGIVALSHALLDFYGATHGINDTDKLAITGGFDNPTVMLSNLEINELRPGEP